MTDSIVQLTVSDFDEAVRHLSLVFNDANFAELVPSLYEPTDQHMRRHLAIRRNGRIAAIVGVYPIDWVVGNTRLNLAGIGAVSVHPDDRGHGLMRMLMDEAMRQIERERYHAACLGGNRRRYGHWGFEKAGVEASCLVSSNSLHHSVRRLAEGRSGSLRVEAASPSDIPGMHSLYRRQPIHCVRTDRAFPRHLRNWRRQPLVVRNADDSVAGYACIEPGGSSWVECCFESDSAFETLLAHQIDSSGRPQQLALPLLNTHRFTHLVSLSDDVSLIEASNWRIYDWPAVFGALLSLKHSVTPLAPGSCTVTVAAETGSGIPLTGMPITIRMCVAENVTCEAVDDSPDFESDPANLLRVLASPCPPEVPRRACSLALWRPLPLMIPMQDRI